MSERFEILMRIFEGLHGRLIENPTSLSYTELHTFCTKSSGIMFAVIDLGLMDINRLSHKYEPRKI